MLLKRWLTELKLRGVSWAAKALDRRSAQPTIADLEARVATGKAMADLLASKPWEAYRDHLRACIAKNKDALVAMPVSDFQSARGLQLRELIRAQEAVLEEPAYLIQRALAAERTLDSQAARKR